jgi:RNA polymerase sigma factor (sigma-70 family)
MTDLPDFTRLVERLRGGDPAAAEELVRHYQAVVRTWVRRRLSDPGRTPSFDWEDVWQSVLCSFFTRLAAGRYDLTDARQLEGLLFSMANNKVIDRLRRELRFPLAAEGDGALAVLPDPQPLPDRTALSSDLLRRVLNLLNPEERAMGEMRADGRSWPHIAAALGGTAAGRRMQFARAVARATRQLGLDGGADDA